MVSVLVLDDSARVHLLHESYHLDADFVGLARLVVPSPHQVVRALVAEELEPIELVVPKRVLLLNVLDDVLLKHLLTDHQRLLLIVIESFGKPLDYLVAPAAHIVLAEPAVLVVLHLDVFVHNVGPLLDIRELVVLDLGFFLADTVLVFG